MKQLALMLFAVASALSAFTIRAEEPLVSDYTYIARDANDKPPVQMPRRTVLKAQTKYISVVGFINTGVSTNISGVAHKQFMGYTMANFDASEWSIVYKWGTGFNQSLYVIAPHEETVDVSPLKIGSTTYEHCYRTIFYLPASASSAYAVAVAYPPTSNYGNSYKRSGQTFTRRGAMGYMDYVMTGYDSSETEYYKVNTATTLSPTGTVGNISYINLNDVTPMEEITEDGFVAKDIAKFGDVVITGTLTYKGSAFDGMPSNGAVLTNGTLKTKSGTAITASNVGAASAAEVNQMGQALTAVSGHLNAEDARFVSTNYDSVVRMPEAYVEIKINNNWQTIWKEMTRWTKFVGNAFNWNTWQGFHAWSTNVTAQLATKAERCWGIYDSETGELSPDGYTQISSSNILIAANMSYKRVVDTANAIWVLESNSGLATLGGTNGYFRVKDGDGNTQFEIIKGNLRELGCDAGGITVNNSGATPVLTIPYSVVAASHPTLKICTDLTTADWKAESEATCAATVSWSGSSGAYVATVTAKSASSAMFVKATYMGGSETIIRQLAPVEMANMKLNGTTHTLGVGTIGQNKLLSLNGDCVIDIGGGGAGTPLSGRTYDFDGGTDFTYRLYVTLTDVIQTLGGSVTNAPAFN